MSKVTNPFDAFTSNELGTESGVVRKCGGTSVSDEVSSNSTKGDGKLPDPTVEQSNNELVNRGTEHWFATGKVS